jgi:nucleotide-binding universal stress UspA family protein
VDASDAGIDKVATTRKFTTILVGVDGSSESDRASAVATTLATQLGAEIVAAHAIGLLDVWPGPDAPRETTNPSAHVTMLMEGPWTETIRRNGVEPRVILRDGPPAQVLLGLADEIDADLIVVGSRGIGQAELFALGETSTKLAHESSRPVLIVPAARATGNTRKIGGPV